MKILSILQITTLFVFSVYLIWQHYKTKKHTYKQTPFIHNIKVGEIKSVNNAKIKDINKAKITHHPNEINN